MQWASSALEPLLPPSLRAGSLQSLLFRRGYTKGGSKGSRAGGTALQEVKGLQEGRVPARRAGVPGAGSNVPLPGVGGKRRSAYVTPSSIPPSVSRSAPHGGSGNPLPAPFGSLMCDAKWKVSFPGGVPRGTTWATTLGGSRCCWRRGRGESPSQAGTPGIPITREPRTPGCGAARGGDACWLRHRAMAALGSRVEAAPPAPNPWCSVDLP